MENNSKIYVSIIVFVVVLSVMAVLFYYTKPSPSAIIPSPAGQNPEAGKTYEQILAEKTKNGFPATSSSTPILLKGLDPALTFLIASDASNVVVESALYADQTKGFTVTYEEKKDSIQASQTFLDILKKNNFDIISAIRNQSSLLILSQNPNYKVELNVDGNKVSIRIQKIASAN